MDTKIVDSHKRHAGCLISTIVTSPSAADSTCTRSLVCRTYTRSLVPWRGTRKSISYGCCSWRYTTRYCSSTARSLIPRMRCVPLWSMIVRMRCVPGLTVVVGMCLIPCSRMFRRDDNGSSLNGRYSSNGRYSLNGHGSSNRRCSSTARSLISRMCCVPLRSMIVRMRCVPGLTVVVGMCCVPCRRMFRSDNNGSSLNRRYSSNGRYSSNRCYSSNWSRLNDSGRLTISRMLLVPSRGVIHDGSSRDRSRILNDHSSSIQLSSCHSWLHTWLHTWLLNSSSTEHVDGYFFFRKIYTNTSCKKIFFFR